MFFGLFWGDWTILVLIPAMIFASAAARMTFTPMRIFSLSMAVPTITDTVTRPSVICPTRPPPPSAVQCAF